MYKLLERDNNKMTRITTTCDNPNCLDGKALLPESKCFHPHVIGAETKWKNLCRACYDKWLNSMDDEIR